MDQVRLGVIGLGAVFQVRHGPELRKIPEARITVVADVRADVARQAAQDYDCRQVTDYRELLDDREVDAVLVCAPPPLHERIVVDAAEAGKHVLCEKPMAPTAAACQAMIDAAERAGVKLMVAENWVMSPLTMYVRQCLDEARLGPLRLLCVAMGWNGPTQPRFYDSPVRGRNGFMLEDGTHMLAMSRALLGPARSVTARCRTVKPRRQLESGVEVVSKVEDLASITLDFDGAVASLAGSWLMDPGGLFCQFHFERGFIGVDTPGWESMRVIGHAIGDQGLEPLALPELLARAPSSQDSYLIEDQAFVRSVLEDTPVRYPATQAQQDVRLMELVYEASEQGRTVRLDR